MKILPLSKNGYQTFPITDKDNNPLSGVIEISESDFQKLESGLGCFNQELTKVVDYYQTDEEQIKDEELRINNLRTKRSVILEAFDKYKINVYYGITIETTELKEQILEWYQQLLDLNEEAFNNIPKAIKYYLPSNFNN